VTNIDPEFSGPPTKKAGHAERPARFVRPLIYAQAFCALLTAAGEFDTAARMRGWIDWDARTPLRDLEGLGYLAFFSAFVFPLLVLLAAGPGPRGKAFRRAMLATLALTAFQFFAILPAVQ
jgi:hypothetical protein